MYTGNPIDRKPTAFERLKDLWNEQPLLVIGVATGATAAAAKFIDAVVKAGNSRTWRKEVKRRTNLGKRPVDYTR